MNTAIKIIGLMTLIALLSAATYTIFFQKEEFKKPPQTILQEEQAPIILPEDYDTQDMQVRHLTWGKLNYHPETITVKAGKKVQLVGDTSRLQGCFRSFTIPDLDITGSFDEGKNAIEFTPMTVGEFGFGCSMGMGSGKLIVQ